jgi:Type IV secretory system Conjugative DNA transfer
MQQLRNNAVFKHPNDGIGHLLPEVAAPTVYQSVGALAAHVCKSAGPANSLGNPFRARHSSDRLRRNDGNFRCHELASYERALPEHGGFARFGALGHTRRCTRDWPSGGPAGHLYRWVVQRGGRPPSLPSGRWPGPRACVCHTRSGKGVGLVIPRLLIWLESCIVYDIKGENWIKTAGFRQEAGQVCFRFSSSRK